MDNNWPEMNLYPIGKVASPLTVPSLKPTRDSLEPGISRENIKKEHHKIHDMVSEIHVFESSTRRLKGVEAFSHILVIYWPHLIAEEKRDLEQVHPMGRKDIEKQGIFATCSPARPNPVLVSAVRLVERKGNVLVVKGFEAVDNSPVIDIKPYSPHYMLVEDLTLPEWMENITSD
ncbi:MAG: tRNA (N6-threonylcarbamoyladenosine(37)-N6)-methyltransferase TrmO [Desulfobacter sp.]|nr:MAG: tRNA (N6-threonylcarbamoyladenosine(37)-N6)-methyltransferase TrmO [Desulfobacter sp.]